MLGKGGDSKRTPRDELGPAGDGGRADPARGVWARLLRKTRAEGVPLSTILTTIGFLVATYLLAKILYGLREVVLLFLVGGFVALVLNPQVLALHRWGVRRRGVAVLLVSLWAIAVFPGLAVAFGYPLVNSLTNLAYHLPGYIDNAYGVAAFAIWSGTTTSLPGSSAIHPS